jgi:hypothetical protein
MEVLEPAIYGLSVLATLRVTNRGQAPVTIPSRLNLMEGAVSLTITGPDQATRTIHGWQADTELREVTLAPNEQLAGAINLLQTESGPIFTTPGNYKLRVTFSPSPRVEEISSPEYNLTVKAPHADLERGAAQLLENENVRRAIVLGQPDEAPAQLGKLAGEFAETVDGKLARLLLAGATNEETADVPDTESPSSLVPLITALRTPYSSVGKRLASSLATRLEGQDSTKENDDAIRILRGEPIKV